MIIALKWRKVILFYSRDTALSTCCRDIYIYRQFRSSTNTVTAPSHPGKRRIPKKRFFKQAFILPFPTHKHAMNDMNEYLAVETLNLSKTRYVFIGNNSISLT